MNVANTKKIVANAPIPRSATNTQDYTERRNRDEKNRIKIYMGNWKQEQQCSTVIQTKKYIFSI